jgi:hypothetical protein
MHPTMRVINVPWDGIRRARVIAAMALAGKRRLPWGMRPGLPRKDLPSIGAGAPRPCEAWRRHNGADGA